MTRAESREARSIKASVEVAPELDPVELAAQFVSSDPGWTDRVGATHIQRLDGDCTGCGSYRPVKWPCVLIKIRQRALEIQGSQGRKVARKSPSSVFRKETQPFQGDGVA